jgi:hypothetical protein
MLFDEYEINFMSETEFLIFSQVRNKFHIHQQSIEFSIYYIFFALETCLFQIWKVLEHLYV